MQLADELSDAISSQSYAAGEALPSINQISQFYGISRDTVFKALGQLKDKGIIASEAAKSYYVKNVETKILLLLDIYSPYKAELYGALNAALSEYYSVDLYFHHRDEDKFNKIIKDSSGRYNYYLVMNYHHDRYCEILDELPQDKLMLLDFGTFDKGDLAYACQDFESAFYDSLRSGLSLFQAYRHITMLVPQNSEHPLTSQFYFKQFCQDYGMSYDISSSYDESSIAKGNAYLIVSHKDMIEIIKVCRKKNLIIGQDVGLVVINDEPVFEILDKGITVISTDFKKMGELAAQFVKGGKNIQSTVQTQLILRSSL